MFRRLLLSSRSNIFRFASTMSLIPRPSPTLSGERQRLHGNPSSIDHSICSCVVSRFSLNDLHVRGFSTQSSRESLDYDVVIVGAGPSGLSAAIRLKQLCKEKNKDLSVCVLDKGAYVGAHIISGNVFEPRALDELLPQWREEGAPVEVPVSSDRFCLLTKDHAIYFPSPFKNQGNYVISLSQFVSWLGTKAEELCVEIYPGFAASEVLYDENRHIIGVGTNDMGVAKDGSKRENFQRGVELKG